jgi:two-component system, cell cycle sensor histidine kinase and response regulator CckA
MPDIETKGSDSGTPLNVLILEDRPSDAELMVAALHRSGFDPKWHRVDTEEEYVLALCADLDVILADYSLPQFDGERALALLKERGLEVPFIVVSGSIGEEHAVSIMKRGAADYLLKDRLGRLGEAVKHTLDQRRLRLETQLHQAQRKEERAALEARVHQAQRLESIGQLAGGVAHDFNNLLAGIMNYAGLVSDTIAEQMALRGLTEDEAFRTLAQDVEEIKAVAKRAADLTHQLLIFSRREVVKLQVLDLNAIVGDMEKLLRRTIGEDIDLRTTLMPGLPKTKLDRGQIEQVLMNLVVNARDAMPKGGRLEMRTAEFLAHESYAQLHAIRPGRYVRLSVSDTGSGMPPDVAARAFEPFFTTKPKGKGSGLGLATVYGIVTQAGGDVVIYSEPGLGTTIRVDVPVSDDETISTRDLVYERPLSSKGETVLLVEDEEMVREPARRMLVRHGYMVLAAADADEALRVAGEHRGGIDLLLTDVVLPRRSGKELSSDLAKLSPTTKVLFMSGYSEDVIVHQGVVDEGVNLIEKPFTSESLLGKIRDILDTES